MAEKKKDPKEPKAPKEPQEPKTPKKQPRAKYTFKLKGKLYPAGSKLSPEDVKIFDELKCTYIT